MRWTKVTTRVPKPKNNPGYIVTNGRAVWLESAHPSWWNFRGRHDRNAFKGPVVTHWMPLPKLPCADRVGA